MKRFKGKSVIVTGSNTGIGAQTIKSFSEEGANVVINYIKNAEDAKKLVEEIKNMGNRVIAIEADVSKNIGVDKLVNACLTEYGSVDILVNNAAIIGTYKKMTEYTDNEWDTIIDTNLKGPFLMMRKVIPEMLKNKKGKIVNISSVSIYGERGICAYCASKGGLASLTKTLSLEYASEGININAVCPSSVDTDMIRNVDAIYPGTIVEAVKRIPAGRLAKPRDIADAILFLSSKESDFIHGALLFVDGSIMNNIQ